MNLDGILFVSNWFVSHRSNMSYRISGWSVKDGDSDEDSGVEMKYSHDVSSVGKVDWGNGGVIGLRSVTKGNTCSKKCTSLEINTS